MRGSRRPLSTIPEPQMLSNRAQEVIRDAMRAIAQDPSGPVPPGDWATRDGMELMAPHWIAFNVGSAGARTLFFSNF